MIKQAVSQKASVFIELGLKHKHISSTESLVIPLLTSSLSFAARWQQWHSQLHKRTNDFNYRVIAERCVN